MKKLVIALSLAAAVSSIAGNALAKPTTPAPVADSSVHHKNPYSNAGIDNPKLVTDYLAKLQAAVKGNKTSDVAALMRYPLSVNDNGISSTVKSKQEFVKSYSSIFTSSVRANILAQKADKLFSNQNGVSIGEGTLWLSQFDNAVSVYAINLPDNLFAVAGIKDPTAFTSYFEKLQKNVAKNNKTAVADSISFPLRVNHNGKSVMIKTKKEFIAKYDKIMTAQVKKKLLAQKVDKLFVNWKGVMVGDGEVWLGQTKDQLSIIAINR